ncbi:MAG: glycoside hydrolase family 32 protein [Vibrio sp.]
MSLDLLIELAGGMHNVRRILAPSDFVIIAVHDNERIQRLPAEVTAASILGEWQLCMARGSIRDEELRQVGEQIAHQQSRLAKPYLTPTSSHYRPLWHISPPQGLLNDPNGFVYHQGEYHLFYQWYPYTCEHKDKYWVHLTSVDLVNWHYRSVALTPSDWFDSHGVFSGHAVSQEEGLYVFYTGNVRLGETRDRQTMQCLAYSSDGRHFTKCGPVIRQLPPGVTEHIRDPKVFYTNNQWLMLLGSQTTDLEGRLAVYHSENLTDWQFDGLYGDEIAQGYMWECPDTFELNGQRFFVFGPQGIKNCNPHHTVGHQNRIYRMSLDENNHPTLHEGWQLDAGFDFYAPQTSETIDGRRVMIGWMGLPDEIDHPSCDDQWLHQLTTLREIHWDKGQLIQRPAQELQQLRQTPRSLLLTATGLDVMCKSYELTLDLDWGQELRVMAKGESYVSLLADCEQKVLRLDRQHTDRRDGDVVRELPLHSERIALTIFADQSSLEIFINQGEKVMTTRVFTPHDATNIVLLGGESSAILYPLKAATAPFITEI